MADRHQGQGDLPGMASRPCGIHMAEGRVLPGRLNRVLRGVPPRGTAQAQIPGHEEGGGQAHRIQAPVPRVALCAGKPILAVGEPEGEISQLLVDKDVGWVVSPGDSDKIVAAVQELLADRSVLRGMSARAREVAETEYSSTYIIDRYAEMIEEYHAD